ncbi:MAG: ATP-binding cassette domain-containing protein [Polyangiaceae bacterium]|nr:ATP-binding cassette domain-containing protein [Polyangiaceae bacterium]
MPIAIAQGSLAIISGALMKGFVSGFSSIHPWLKVLPWTPTVLVGAAMASVALRGVCSIALRTFARARSVELEHGLRNRILSVPSQLQFRARPRHPDHGVQTDADAGDGQLESFESERLAVATEGVTRVVGALDEGWLRAFLAFLELLVLVGVLFSFAKVPALLSLLCFLVLAELLWRRERKRRHSEDERVTRSTKLLASLEDLVWNAKIYEVFGESSRARERCAGAARKVADIETSGMLRKVRASTLNELLAMVVLGSLIANADSRTFGMLPPERVAPFAICFLLCYRPLRDLVDAQAVMAMGEAWAKRIQQFLGETEEGPLLRAGPNRAEKGEIVDPSSDAFEAGPLEVSGLRLPYGSREPISFAVAPGEILAVTGPNGIGKSSLVAALLGFLPTSEGTMCWGALSLAEDPARRPFAWMPQMRATLAGTVRENLFLGEETEAIRLLPDMVRDRFDQEARTLSMGEQAVVAFWRAVLSKKKPILLLDEPTVSLDEERVQAMFGWIENAAREKRTVVVVTHDERLLLRCHRVLRLTHRSFP